MSADEDVEMSSDQRPYEPFTTQENIQQLNAIDTSIGDLMSQVATALDSLTTELPSGTATPPEPSTTAINAQAKQETYRKAIDAFFASLQSIDVRMKRQIFALEEAGIVDLTPKQEGGKPGEREGGGGAMLQWKPDPSLKPNGMGSVGKLDVGWLNSRGSKVERDMERELWEKTRRFLEEKGKELTFERSEASSN